jgi:S-adenosylmethionine decarboxylase
LEKLRLGTEWLVDAHGCDAESLRSEATLARVFDRAVAELGLHPLGAARFHTFPGAGGVTGLLMLSESHLACHTFPEAGFAAFDLYCCQPREEWPWAERLSEALGASDVSVRRLTRGAP